MEHDRDWYLARLTADIERFATAIRADRLDAPVVGCPGWDVRALTAHLGMVHRWARHNAANAAPHPDFASLAPDPGADATTLAAWFEAGAAELLATLRTIDLEGPTWHPFPMPRLGKVWPRRQAHESSVHRWDAETAVGAASPIDPELASDGIDEYFELVIPRLVKREGIALPTGSLHVHCTDVHGEWLVWVDADGYHLERAHAKGAAALRGPAEALLLRLWGRPSPRTGELSPVGDQAVLDAWLDLAGL